MCPDPNDERQSARTRSEESEGREFCRGKGVEGDGVLAVERWRVPVRRLGPRGSRDEKLELEGGARSGAGHKEHFRFFC